MLVREFKYWRMFPFLLGITLHTFSISWMRNDRFDVKANIWLRFTSQRFRSSRFTSEYFTCSPSLSSRFTGPLSVVQVFAVFVLKVCVLIVRVCQVQSSPGANNFLSDDVISLPVPLSQWYVYPHTHITSDMCIPTGDTQNTEAHLGIRWTKWQLGCEVLVSAVKSRRNQKWL